LTHPKSIHNLLTVQNVLNSHIISEFISELCMRLNSHSYSWFQKFLRKSIMVSGEVEVLRHKVEVACRWHSCPWTLRVS